MMKVPSNQKGVTLIEVLVASMLSIVIGGVLYAVFFMYSNQSRTTITSLLMQQQYDNVSQQIARDVHRAAFVLPQGETPSTRGAGFDSVAIIYMWNSSGAVFAQYEIEQDKLLEGASRMEFQAGGGIVHLIAGGSFFIVTPQRNSVGLNLVVSKANRGVSFSLPPRRDIYLCRN